MFYDFDYHVPNSFVEGENKRIKIIKHMAYGYHNIDDLRKRMFLSTNNEVTANARA
jgi:transposase